MSGLRPLQPTPFDGHQAWNICRSTTFQIPFTPIRFTLSTPSLALLTEHKNNYRMLETDSGFLGVVATELGVSILREVLWTAVILVYVTGLAFAGREIRKAHGEHVKKSSSSLKSEAVYFLAFLSWPMFGIYKLVGYYHRHKSASSAE